MSRSLVNQLKDLQAPQLDYLLIDGSGSMMDKWWDLMSALDGFMGTLRAQNVHSHGIASVFDSQDLAFIQRDSLISEWAAFNDDPLALYGGYTPLYDAINHMGRHLQRLDPPKASIVIGTDGDENESKFTNAAQAKAILDWCRAKGWQVTFFGCDFDNTAQAKLLGANESNSVGVRKQKLLEAAKSLGKKRVIYGMTGEEINFSPEERQKFGGYLTGPSK